MNPSLEDIDDNGFRNRKVLQEADIVTLGDSHTFGNNVSSENSWPQQLANMTNMTVYNFGVGGYGSLQYYYLINEAIKLKPKYVILGLYLVNDLYDVCTSIRGLDFWNKWAREHNYNLALCSDPKTSPPLHRSATLKAVKSLSKQTAIGSLILYSWGKMSARLSIIRNRNKKTKKDNAVYGNVVVNEETNKTVITDARISRHERYTDLNQADVFLAVEITRDIFKDMKKKTDLNGIDFSVIFIPSKERSFFDYLVERGYQLPSKYYKLVSNEDNLVNKYSAFFREINIKFVDAKPYVVKELYRSGSVYPYADDGHPLEVGYKAYAQAVYDNIFARDANSR
jgi:hypothetical protein